MLRSSEHERGQGWPKGDAATLEELDSEQDLGPAEPAATEIWETIAQPGLTNTIRRICTLSGCTGAQNGATRSLAIVSAQEGEGKSTIAQAVAIAAAADTDDSVLLVECELLTPTLADDLELPAGPGLGEVLSGEDIAADLVRCLRPTGLHNLWVLPAGAARDNPSRLLRSAKMEELLLYAKRRFALVVLDLPAVLKNNESAVLARLADAVVLVIRARATEQRTVRQALWLLSGATVRGVVLNRAQQVVPGLIRRVIGD